MDVNGGLTRKSLDRFALFLFTFPFVFESELSTLLEMQKASQIDWLFLVDRNIELSNLDALFDRSRQYLIWDELAEFELLELDYLETFPFLENK
jgi:hypothetical protein